MAKRGEKLSKETKEKIRAFNFGSKKTVLTKKRISNAIKKKWKQEQYRKKCTLAAGLKKISKQHRKKIGAAMRLRDYSNELERNAKISEALKNYWKNKTDSEKTKLLCNFITAGAKSRGMFDTKIELRVEKFLQRANVKYEKQKIFCAFGNRAICDFYLPKFNIVLECDGSYWHNTKEQKQKDEEKDLFYAKLGLNVMRLSESEINNHLRISFLKKLKSITEGARNVKLCS